MLIIITPIYSPAPGGAAIYYQQLVYHLRQANYGKKILILTENHPARKLLDANGLCTVLGLFPKRASHRVGPTWRYVSYFVQNALMLMGLLFIFAIPKNTTIILHSSFFNYPSVTPFVLAALKRVRSNLKLILDARDLLMPEKRIGIAKKFNTIICCSLRIQTRYLAATRGTSAKTLYIPVPVEELEEYQKKPDLSQSKPYIFYAGPIRKEKGVGTALDFFCHFSKRHPGFKFLIGGVVKDICLMDRIENVPNVEYVGVLTQKEVLEYMAGSRFCIYISESEGLGRFCLEAMALGIPTILPMGVEEFNQHAKNLVPNSYSLEDIDVVADRIMSKGFQEDFPIERHYWRNATQLYLAEL